MLSIKAGTYCPKINNHSITEKQHYQSTISSDTISFSGNSTPLDEDYQDDFKTKCQRFLKKIRGYAPFTFDEIKLRIEHKLKKRGFDKTTIPAIMPDIWATRLELDTYDNSIKLSHFDITSMKDFEEIAEGIECILNVKKNLGDRIMNIAQESIKLLDLKGSFNPIVTLFYDQSGTFGSYDQLGHRIVLNAYWLEKTVYPELVVAEIVLHELSHAKTNLNSALIETSDLMEELEKYPELLAKINKDEHFNFRRDMCNMLNISAKKPDKNSPEYQRYMWHLIQDLKDSYNPRTKQINTRKSSDKFTEMKKKIAHICNLDYRELYGISLYELLESGKVLHKGNHVDAIFDSATKQRIREKIETNKDSVRKILKSNKNLMDRHSKDYQGYSDIYDEALARQNSSIYLLKLIDKGFIVDNDQTRRFASQHLDDLKMLVLRTDNEVKELIESGHIKLDEQTIKALENE